MQDSADIAAWQMVGPEIMDTDKYLSSANAPDLEEDIRLCVASGARQMIINCAALTYLTGAGVRTFLSLARLMSEVGGTLSVQNLKGQPREIFNSCGMDALINVIESDAPELSLVTDQFRVA